MSKTVFITGAAGLIGRHLTRKLAERGDKVICFDLGEQFARHRAFFEQLRSDHNIEIAVGTILDRNGLSSTMADADAVFHLAAMLGVKRTEANRLRCIEVNITGTDNVLDACVRNRVERFVFASSSEVYGEPSENPIKETHETKGKTVYAVTKLAGEELTKGYAQLYPWLKPTIVRFFNTYGEGQVAQFVLTRFVHRVLNGENPVVYGSGDQLRSYGHVSDVTDGLIAALENPIAHGKTYNLGNSHEICSLRQLAEKVIAVLGPDKGLSVDVLNGFDGSDRTESREIFSRYCDTSLAAAELGYAPKISLEDGIRRIAESGEIHSDWSFEP